MKCSACGMFASSNVDKLSSMNQTMYIYSLHRILDVSVNYITHSVINSDEYVTSKLHSIWLATLYNLATL